MSDQSGNAGDPLDGELGPLRDSLLRARDAEARSPAPALDDVLARVRTEATQRGPLTRLREGSTRTRVVAACAVAAFLGAGMLVLAPRADFAAYPISRFGLALVVLLGGAALTIRAALRPVCDPPIARNRSLALAAVAVLAPLVLAVIPYPAVTETPGASSPLSCVVFGSMMVVPLLGLLWALGRGGPATGGGAVMAAAACGLTANLVLEMHCRATDVEHLVIGHASVAALFVAAAVAVRLVLRR